MLNLLNWLGRVELYVALRGDVFHSFEALLDEVVDGGLVFLLLLRLLWLDCLGWRGDLTRVGFLVNLRPEIEEHSRFIVGHVADLR